MREKHGVHGSLSGRLFLWQYLKLHHSDCGSPRRSSTSFYDTKGHIYTLMSTHTNPLNLATENNNSLHKHSWSEYGTNQSALFTFHKPQLPHLDSHPIRDRRRLSAAFPWRPPAAAVCSSRFAGRRCRTSRLPWSWRPWPVSGRWR